MMLGNLIARMTDDATAHEMLLSMTDIATLTELRKRADVSGMTLAIYAARAVSRFAAQATDEDWVTLIGALNRAPDPGALFLKRALAHDDQPVNCTLRS